MWERILLFLDVKKEQLKMPPKREVLWEQDAWNDLAKSIELQRRVFPWAFGYGLDSDLWTQIGYHREVRTIHSREVRTIHSREVRTIYSREMRTIVETSWSLLHIWLKARAVAEPPALQTAFTGAGRHSAPGEVGGLAATDCE